MQDHLFALLLKLPADLIEDSLLLLQQLLRLLCRLQHLQSSFIHDLQSQSQVHEGSDLAYPMQTAIQITHMQPLQIVDLVSNITACK